ncbi:MAG TPA: ATP-binding cassette domain-containing protein [Candidatus Binatia bacterium]|nr:ATP-binding cassette domain-containing protein [Candidatus Binatia bacterium]
METANECRGPWRTACLAALVALATLSGLVLMAGVLPLDGAVRSAIVGQASPAVETVIRWLNYGGAWQFLLPAMVVLVAVSPDGRRHWWLWACVLPLGALAEGALKELVGRTRPESPAMGFPSGHVAAASAFAVLVIYLVGRMRPGPGPRRVVTGAALALIAFVGLARVMLRAHWPSDVLGGLALGVGVAAAAAWWHTARLASPSRAPSPAPAVPACEAAEERGRAAGRARLPLVELSGVAYRYREAPVLEGIDLRVMPGDFLGIIGPNGSGKTTLLRVMLGLLPPTRGTVRLFGQAPAALGEWRRLGYVPQKTALDTGLPITVTEVVSSGLVAAMAALARRSPADRRRVAEALERVGMRGHGPVRIGDLSAGQQQRVLIARALVSDPELLILDEPTGGVDPEAQTSFYALLRHLHRERDVTLILVSHDIGVVAREVTQLACLNHRLVFHGRPADFLGDPALLTALYGAPVDVVEHDH